MGLKNLKRQQYQKHAKTVSFTGTLSGVCRQETYVLQANSASAFECETSLLDQAILSQQTQLTRLFYT
jgi:hypothetical protein